MYRARYLRTLVVILALGCAGAGWLSAASAQTLLSGGRIAEIRVEGTERTEPATVRSYMRLNPGDPFDPLRLDRSLKSIFATGLFADVTLSREGDTLVVAVVENPIVNRIAFEGNRRVDDETLGAEIGLRQRSVFTRTKAQQDAQRILDIYRSLGRYAASVDPKVVQLEQNRVDLIFEIKEGPLSRIKAINFIGNRAFSDGDLRDEIASSESAFWRFLSTTDTYDPFRLDRDRELLRRFYREEGYADFGVNSVVAELSEDRESFIVTFTVEEGERYRFGSLDVATTLKNLDVETLRDEIVGEEGDWYDAGEVEETRLALTERVSNLGYAFVEVRPRVDQDTEGRIIGITYEIDEGLKVYVERIEIEGNERTLDRVIRREMRLVEGDAFNAAKLRRSRQRIQNLGFFANIEMEEVRGSAPDTAVVKVEVQEQATGEVNFGVGFSTAVGPIVSAGIRERNLLGRGQDLRFDATLAGEETQFDLSFTEPYFLERNLSAGADLFHVENTQEERAFDLLRTGGSLRTGFSYDENWRHIFRYTLESKEISDVDDDASLFVKSEEGDFLTSSLSHELIYDTRDSRFDPRRGRVLRLKNQVAGLGGDLHFVKSSLGGAQYFPLAENWTISLRAEAGNIIGIGEDTRISDRHYIGGSNLRGFEFAGVGPRDRATGDAVGGNLFYTGGVELRFPLGLPEELRVRGRLFADIGASWDVDDGGNEVFDSDAPRVSVGTGLTWESPFGPIVIDLGFAVVKEDFDETETLNFSFGTRF